MKPIPHGATAVGAPARVIGWARESKPGSSIDMSLKNVVTVSDDSNMPDSSPDSFLQESDDIENIGVSTIHVMEDENYTEANSDKGRKNDYPNFCIFRAISASRKTGQLSYEDLNCVLKNCCSEDEIGEVYMELLRKESKSNISKGGKCFVFSVFDSTRGHQLIDVFFSFL